MRRLESLYIAAFSIGSLIFCVFILGHLGLLAWPFLAASVAAAVIGYFYFEKKAFGGFNRPACLSNRDKGLLGLLFAFILLILPLSMTPPAVRDELIHHLAVPKLYLAKGRIFEIPFMGFSYLPQNIDLLYLIPLALGNDIVPRLIHFAFGLLTGLAIYFYLRPGLGRSWGLLGFIFFISTPVVVNLSKTAYIDLGSAFFSTLAVIGALRYKEEGVFKWLALSAAALGLGLGAKYTNLVTLFLIGFFILHSSYSRERRLFSAVKSGLIYAGIAFAVLSPWLIRNYIWTGSPLYPLVQIVSPSAGTAAAPNGAVEAVRLSNELPPLVKRELLYGEGFLDIVLLPLRVFWEGVDNSLEKFDGVLNPVFLLLIPLAFLRKQNDGKWLGLFALLYFIATVLTIDLAIRYVMPAIPALTILAVYGARNAFGNKSLRPLGILLAAAFLGFNLYYIKGLYERYHPTEYLAGKKDRDAYLSEVLPDYSVVKAANRMMPEGSRVIMLFAGERGYYWDHDYFYPDRLGNYFKVLIKNSRDGAEIKKRFKEAGFTHVFTKESLLAQFAAGNFSDDEIRVVSDFFMNHTVKVASGNGFSVFHIK